MITFRDRYKTTITNAPSTLGDFVISTAYLDYQTFDTNDNGLLFDVVITDGPTTWEIRKACTYNHSTHTLSRGTFSDSSSGLPIDLTNNAILAVTLLAERALPVTITNPVLDQTIVFNGTDFVNAPAPPSSYTQVLKHLVKNDSGIALTKGQAVYISGANGTNILVKLAQANTELTSSKTIGLLETDLAVNGIGYVVDHGLLTGTGGVPLNTLAATIGDAVWLSPTTAGGLLFGLANKPHAPNHLVYLGVVTRVHGVNGEIDVKVQNGFELDELHDVAIVTPTNNDFLVYETSTTLWKNKQLTSSNVTTALGYTPYNSTNPNGYTTNVGTVTNTSGTGPISVATGTTTPVISISQANSTTNGYLSSTDWNTFNNKQNTLSAANSTTNGYLTSTDWNTFNNKGAPYTLPTASNTVLGGIKVGTSLSITAGVLDVNSVTSAQIITGLGYTPYNSTNPNGYTTNVGTVTNVSALTLGTTGTDISSTVATGTTTPVITLNIPTASATNRGALSSTDWTTFNNKQNTLSAANSTTNGYLTSTDWNTFNNKGDPYTLPTASNTVLGGIKVGTGLSIDVNGVLNASGGGGGIDLPTLHTLTLGYY
jgi:hypothetical protein